ncbi:Uncharacterized protein FWK35_00019579 [Aphis craccivora]|uniref:Uncharacterized protein n=1 Tax=Aphis craccivora TaxID=307492 RepID=A0A6G0Y1F5_APHCR|nr:Uncharacterized protein FWK35_00019579 [Aphis craccivora]
MKMRDTGTTIKTTHKKLCIKFSIFDLQPYKKIDLVENWFCVKIPVFLVFLDAFENYWKFFTNFLTFDPKVPTRFAFLSETGSTFQNRSTFTSFTAPKHCDRHKKTHIIVKS